MTSNLRADGLFGSAARTACRAAIPLILSAAAWLAASGCAAPLYSTRFSLDADGGDRGGATGSHVTRLELTPHADGSLEDVLGRLRPEWFHSNASSRQVMEPARASIYIDGVYTGDSEVLGLVPIAAVIDVWFLHPVEAIGRFGPTCHCEGGVILVETRAGRTGAR